MLDVHLVLLYLKIGKISSEFNLHFLYIPFIRIYAIGGRDGTTDLRETESFDPHTNRWSQCAPMQKRRDRVAVVSCDGYLYAIGGHESSTINKTIVRHNDGERYDPKCNQWTLITSFSRPKEGLGIAVVNNILYIIGGFDDKVLNEMEKYDIETEKWRKVDNFYYHKRFDFVVRLVSVIRNKKNWCLSNPCASSYSSIIISR